MSGDPASNPSPNGSGNAAAAGDGSIPSGPSSSNGPSAVKRLWSLPHLLGIEWSDGDIGEFAGLWLRDNLREDRDPHSGQRLVDVADLPLEPRIRSATIRDHAVTIEWEGEPRPASFDLSWLAAHSPDRLPARPERNVHRWLEGAALDASRDFAWATLSELPNDRPLRA